MPQNFVSFFVCNIEKLIVWCISARKNYCNLTKNNHKFQANVTERCTSLSKSSGIFRQNLLKAPAKRLFLKKNYCTWTSSRLRFPVKFFLPIYRNLLVSFTANTFCIRIHICKKYFFRLYYSWDGKRKKNKS